MMNGGLSFLLLVLCMSAQADCASVLEDLSYTYESCNWNPYIWSQEVNIDGEVMEHTRLEKEWEVSTRECAEPGIIHLVEDRHNWCTATMRTLDVNNQLRDAYLIVHVSEYDKIDGYWWGYTEDGVGVYAAEIGQGVDAATTLAGAALGLAELNPISLPILIAIKLVGPQIAKEFDYNTCVELRKGFAIFGIGPGVSNIAAIGKLGLGSLAIGAYTGVKSHKWAENSAELSCL